MTGKVGHACIQMTDDMNGSSIGKDKNNHPRGATVSFHNISYKVQLKSGLLCKRKTNTKEILNDLKFLDILAARKDPAGLSGEILIDGAPQPPNFKCISGYVVQDDVVMGTLTVRENFQFSAALRLPKTVSEREKEAKVNQVIKELGLTKVADSKVGTQLIRGVSGGERKRTNIGMELIIDPPVLFLDEPTTGLDASTANSVLLLLKKMSNSGRTIILSIHQPRYSIYRLFDSLTLLSSGNLVYHGPARNALDYFKNIGYTCDPYNNPADFFLDVINGDSTAVTMNKMNEMEDLDSVERKASFQNIEGQLAEAYCNSTYYENTKADLEKITQGKLYNTRPISRKITYSTSFFHQLKWVSKRTFRNLMLNPQTSVAQIGVTVFLALIVGAIFFGIKDDESGIQNRVGALFFVVTNQCFSTVSAAELFITERKIFIHEYISGYYRLSVYFLSKIMADILTLRTVPSIFFTCVVYFMIGLKNTVSAFFIFMFTITLVSYTATAMTLAISADQSVVAVANIFMTISFVFMMALQVNEFVGLDFCKNSSTSSVPSGDNINCSVSSPFVLCTGEQFLQRQGIEATEWGLWENHLALAIMTLIFLAIAYLKLRFMKKFS
ncbi:UNVERIFIED_CONTAM: hypothetical protein FKN15_049995 [Acipenser sinensis]